MEVTNTARTGPDVADAALRSRILPGPVESVALRCELLLGGLRTYGRKWRVVDGGSPGPGGATLLRAEVPVLVFTDDFTVTLTPQGGRVRVDAHSASRVGKGDFGENRRHVLQFLEALNSGPD